MTRDFFDLPLECTDVILIDLATIQRAQRLILSCEECDPEAEIPFDGILDRLTGHSGATTEYVLELPTRCLQCGGEITEKTLVEWDLGRDMNARSALSVDDSPLPSHD